MPEDEGFQAAAKVERVDLSGDSPEDAIGRAQESCLRRALARITESVGGDSFQVDAVHVAGPYELEGDWYVSATVVVWVMGREERPWPSLP